MTTLKQLAKGKVFASNFILITDTFTHSSGDLLQFFNKQWQELVSVTHCTHWNFSRPLKGFSSPLLDTTNIDANSDPLGWGSPAGKRESKVRRVECTNVSSLDELESSIVKAIKVGSENPLVINTLSDLLLRFSTHEVMKVLATITAIQPGYSSIIAILHRDLHTEATIKAMESISRTIINVITPPLSAGTRIDGAYEIITKRKSGRATRNRVHAQIKNGETIFLTPQMEKELATSTKKEANPASNLTFNVLLTDEQKEAKSKVELPYIHQGQTTEVSYPSDDDDDDLFDDDPDDDLDI